MKRSQHVRLALSGVVASALWTTGCQQEDSAAVAASTPPVVSTNQMYTNNEYVSGVGYYHAPYGGWYARPFNTYLSGRGYYHGGNWWPTPYTGPVLVSTPRPDAVESANVKTEPLRTKASNLSASGGNESSSANSSRSGSTSSTRSSIWRGGFGGSHSSSAS
jgi:hypothetical protein